MNTLDRTKIGDLLFFIADTAALPIVDDFDTINLNPDNPSASVPFNRAAYESFVALCDGHGTALQLDEFAATLRMPVEIARPLFGVINTKSRQISFDEYCYFLSHADKNTLCAYFSCFQQIRDGTGGRKIDSTPEHESCIDLTTSPAPTKPDCEPDHAHAEPDPRPASESLPVLDDAQVEDIALSLAVSIVGRCKHMMRVWGEWWRAMWNR